MRKKIVLYLLCFLTFFSVNCYADNNEISNSYEYIDPSIYHSFINYLFRYESVKYTEYLNNPHCTIYQLPVHPDKYYMNFFYGKISNNDNIFRLNNIDEYNKSLDTTNYPPFATYIAFFTPRAMTYNEVDMDYNQLYHFTEQLTLGPDGDFNFIMVLYSNGMIKIYPNGNTSSSDKAFGFLFNPSSHLVYTDDTIYQGNTALQYATPSNSNSDLFDLDITNNETGSSLYNKIMALYNNQYNVYARLWSNGDKPTVAIYDNSSTNCIVPLLDNNNYIQNKYIAVFSTCRLCEYDQNNNSRHYNTLTYGDDVLHVITFDEGLNNYTFYNLMGRNYQSDVIILTGISGDELLFCNSNIIQKSNANDFVVSNTNQYTYYYYSDLELTSTYPINNNNNNNNDNQSIWNDIQDSINNNTTTLSDTFSDVIEDVYSTSSEFINNTFLPFFRGLFSQISQVIPFDIITDFIEYINIIIQDAISVKDTIIANHGYNFTFNFLNNNINFNPFYYFFTTNMYSIAYLLCNLSFFTYLIFNIYKHMLTILSKN